MSTQEEAFREIKLNEENVTQQLNHLLDIEYEITANDRLIYKIDEQIRSVMETLCQKRDKAVEKGVTHRANLEVQRNLLNLMQADLEKSNTEWKSMHHKTILNADGSCALNWIDMEQIFSYLWDPGDICILRKAVDFQHTCTTFLQTAQGYIRDHPFYFWKYIPRMHNSYMVTETIYNSVHGLVSMQVIERSTNTKTCKDNFRVVYCNTGTERTFTTQLFRMVGSQTEYVMILKPHEPKMRALLVGGRYVPNKYGRVCDWLYTPTTVMDNPFQWPECMRETDTLQITPHIGHMQMNGVPRKYVALIYKGATTKDLYDTYYAHAHVDLDVPCMVLSDLEKH